MIGLQRVVNNPGMLPKGRVGLLTHPAGVLPNFTPSAVALLQAGVPLQRLFAPEHGIDGSGEPGSAPDTGPDQQSGLPVEVLYGLGVAEIAQRLLGLEVLLIDLQDVGARFYTFVSSMAQAIEAAQLAGVQVVVLDRPNPLGFAVDGPIIQERFRSFVGYLPLPVRHGLSVGECARLVNPKVHVVPCDPLQSFGTGALPWIPPSPNLAQLSAVRLYPGMGLVEACSASEGRGTPLPFEWAGATGIDAVALAARLNALKLGCFFRPAWLKPTASKQAGQHCGGVQVHLTEPPSSVLAIGLAVLGALVEQGAQPNPGWLEKLLGLPFMPDFLQPDLALDWAQQWQSEAKSYSQNTLKAVWLYPRT